jgi:hypothetical protein
MNVRILTLKYLKHEIKVKENHAAFDTVGAIQKDSTKPRQKSLAEKTGCIYRET